MNRPRTTLALLLSLACLTPASASAQDEPAAETTQEQPEATEQVEPQAQEPAVAPQPLIVRDLVVLHADHFSELANDPAIVRSSLFVPVPRAGRQRADSDDRMEANQPMPLGLLTFEGAFAEPTRIRVDVPGEGAFLHSHWPQSAQKSSNFIDWFNVQEGSLDLGTFNMDNGTHWLSPLRSSEDRLWINIRSAMDRERFMLYDASVPYRAPMELDYDSDQYVLTHDPSAQGNTERPMLTLLVQRQADQLTSMLLGQDQWPADTVALDPDQVQTREGDAALQPLAELLEQRGYNANEAQTALGMVQMAGLERSTVSLVYVMPEGEIDRHIWLRFRPQPDQVIRTAIVVVTNIDPNLSDQIEVLVLQLGDESWAVRERAQRELINLGQAAIETIQRMRNNEDPEIAFRARQILDAYDLRTQGAGQQQTTSPNGRF